MDGAASDILSTHGEKVKQAVSAGFKVMCPGLGGIVIGDSADNSADITQGVEAWIDTIEEADLSCDETKAGFQIHIYLLPDLNQVT